MLFKLKNQKEGFTIIEVMIVLAIAGLIMLIVFLAVPALERTARNTQRKNDASAIAAAISNWIDNNGGQLPNSTIRVDLNDTSAVDIGCTNGGGGGSTCTTTDTNYEIAKLGYYTAANNFPGWYAAVPAAAPSTSQVFVVDGFTCNSSDTGAGPANSRDVAVLYTLETNSEQCIEE